MAGLKPHPEAEKRFKPFIDCVLSTHDGEFHSIYITGSALVPDYHPKRSDVNSVFVLKEMNFELLETIARLGKKFGKRRIAAPLIMTPDYIYQSLDVFPVEFLDIRLLHYTWLGDDIFSGIPIDPHDLRRQCERELKVKLIGLRQDYISIAGNRRALSEIFIKTFSGYIPLFRGIILLYGKAPPVDIADVFKLTQALTGVDLDPFHTIRRLKRDRSTFPVDQIHAFFEQCYIAVEKIGNIIDALDL